MVKFFIFFFPLLVFSRQKITPENIERQLKSSETLISKGRTDAFLKINLAILEDSKNIDYPRGKVKACYNLAIAYNWLYKYNRSNYYLKLMESELKNINEDDEIIAMNILYSNNYYGVNMYDEAIKKLRQNLTLVNKVKIDSNRCYIKSLAFLDIAKNYNKKRRYDSATYYNKRAIEELKTQKKMNSIFGTNLKIGLLNLAEVKLAQHKIDSTEFYLRSAKSLPVRLGSHEYQTFKISGQICEVRKQYDSAIANYQKSLNLAHELKNCKRIAELYALLSKTYKKAGQIDSSEEYLHKQNVLNDSIYLLEIKNREDTVALFINEKQKPLKNRNNILSYIIIIGILFVIGFTLWIITKIRDENKIFTVKEEEALILSKKLNFAFEEVIQLAKRNDSEFYIRFQEVYPDFFTRLLAIEPDLQRSELKFCALLFLNFSTKDIANYTFVKPQSIQTRKNRIRKRLNIPSDQDIYTWMKKVGEK